MKLIIKRNIVTLITILLIVFIFIAPTFGLLIIPFYMYLERLEKSVKSNKKHITDHDNIIKSVRNTTIISFLLAFVAFVSMPVTVNIYIIYAIASYKKIKSINELSEKYFAAINKTKK